MAVILSTHLYAVLKQIARHREALLFIQRFTEDNYLLEEKDTPLFHAGKETTILVGDHEGVLEKQSSLGYNFTLKAEITKLTMLSPQNS